MSRAAPLNDFLVSRDAPKKFRAGCAFCSFQVGENDGEVCISYISNSKELDLPCKILWWAAERKLSGVTGFSWRVTCFGRLGLLSGWQLDQLVSFGFSGFDKI